MSLFDKVMFWKQKEDVPLTPDVGGLDDDKPPLPGESEMGPLPHEMTGADPMAPPMQGIEPSMGPELGQGSGFERPQVSVSEPPKQGFGESPDIYRLSKEIEVLSSKIDAIKAGIDSISQRLSNMEKSSEHESKYRW